MVHSPQHHERFNRKRVRFLSSLSFLLGFLDAFLVYILSSYFVQITGNEQVGWFYLIAFALVLWLLMHLHPMIRRLGSVRLLLFLLLGLVFLSLALSLSEPSWSGACFLLAFLVCSNLVWAVMDILVEDFSADHVSGRVRGFYLTVLNLGLLLAPWLSTSMLERYNYQAIFAVLTCGYTGVFFGALLGLRRHMTRSLPRIHFSQTLRRAWQSRNIRIIYALSWMLELFYAIMIVYAPILLLRQGLDWQAIGLVFTAMLLPFVLIQYPLGMIADQKWGERELLFGALLLMGGATLAFALLQHQTLFGWGAVLFLTRVGAAALEVLRDSYFYKQIGPGDTDMVALFRSARPVANILGAGLAIGVLAFSSISALFVAVSGLSLGMALLSLKLEDSQPVAKA